MATLVVMDIVLPADNPPRIVQAEAVGLAQWASLPHPLQRVREEMAFMGLQYPL